MKVVRLVSTLGIALVLSAGCQSSAPQASDHTTTKHTQQDNKQKQSTKVSSSGTTKSDSTDATGSASGKTSAPSKKNDHLPTAEALPDIVTQNAMNALHTKLVKRAPVYFPLDSNAYLTAVTSSDDNQFKIVYFSANKPVPVNGSAAQAMSKNDDLVTFSATSYPAAAKAKAVIDAPSKLTSENGSLGLGHNIKATVTSGAGQSHIAWQEGRWSLDVNTPSMLGEFGKAIAKEMVTYLDGHRLLVPNTSGHVTVTYGKNKPETVIKFQEDKTVYSLTTAKDPVEALKMEVSLKTFK